jgi:hypothetical protein
MKYSNYGDRYQGGKEFESGCDENGLRYTHHETVGGLEKCDWELHVNQRHILAEPNNMLVVFRPAVSRYLP